MGLTSREAATRKTPLIDQANPSNLVPLLRLKTLQVEDTNLEHSKVQDESEETLNNPKTPEK